MCKNFKESGKQVREILLTIKKKEDKISKTKDVAEWAKEGNSLMSIQTNDPKITLVAGGYPLFVNNKITGNIGVGGGTEEQDCQIAEFVLSKFEELTKRLIN